ncbi:hypothetical protein RUND412_011003 [Rhizina undulata]
MEFSTTFRASGGSFPSPNGSLIASIVSSKLVLRSAATLQTKRVINLNPDFASRIAFMRWSPRMKNESYCSPAWHGLPIIGKRRSGIDKSEEEGGAPLRILLADEETVQVFDVEDEKWMATINQGFGGIRNVEFGRNADEVIVFSDFQLKVTVWNLISSRLIEIPHPKFSTKGFGYRPCTSHFALLTRSATHDAIIVHQHTTYRVASSFTLPTIDAQGLKWSPCGRWIAVWDSAASGYKVLVYTADGHLYRTYEKPCEGLGVKSVEWSPAGDFLTIGSYDGRLAFLSNYTFSPVIEMNHTRTIRLPGVTVWSECMSSPQDRYYAQVQQPTSLPTISPSPSDLQPKIGISTIAFNNPDGTLIATRNDSMPTTIWIWSLKLLRPYAVLVQLNPIKSITWHPTIHDLLMIQCTPDNPRDSDATGAIYLWSSSWRQPRAISVPLEHLTGSMWARWVYTSAPTASTTTASTASTSPHPSGPGALDRRSRSPEKAERKPMLMCGDREGFIVGYVEEEPVPEDDENGMENGYGLPLSEKRAWDPVDWDCFSPTHHLPRRSLSSASQTNLNLGSNGSVRRKGGPGSVPGDASTSPTSGKECEDVFEYRLRSRAGVTAKS